MRIQQKLRLAGTILAVLAAVLAAVVYSWAQSGDTPIVIGDGSLTMESAVPWAQFTGTGDLKAHPHTNKSVTKVLVTIGGKSSSVAFSNQQCTVEITYASMDITFATGRDGKGLNVKPFSAFRQTDATHLAHNNPNAKISHVTVMKAGAKVFDSDASGGTKITISYQ
jgi:hypothetical protein